MLYKTIAAIVLCGSLSAATVTFNNFNDADGVPTVPIVSSTGSNISGGFVAVGSFTIADSSINIANVAGVKSDFIQFGSSTTLGSAGALNEPVWYSSVANAPIVTGGTNANLIGKNIYTVIGNGTTLANSSEIAVYKNTNTFGADPAAPTTALIGPATATDLSTNLLIGSTRAGVNVGTIQATATGIQLAPVPEPTVAGLGVLALALVRRRRR
jgi:hypothetical protein